MRGSWWARLSFLGSAFLVSTAALLLSAGPAVSTDLSDVIVPKEPHRYVGHLPEMPRVRLAPRPSETETRGRAWLMRQSLGLADLESEPNNTTAAADLMTADATCTGTVDRSTDRSDFYRIHLHAGDLLTITLTFPSGDFDCYLLDPGSNFINRSDRFGGTEEQLAYEVQADGDYYVKVYSQVGSGSYAVMPRVDSDPGSGEIRAFSLGFVRSSLGPPGGADVDDAYSGSLLGGERRMFYLGWDPAGSFRPHVTVGESGGASALLGEQISDGWECADYTAADTQEYLAKVEHDGASSAGGRYKLDICYPSEIWPTSSDATVTVTYGQHVHFTGHLACSASFDHRGSSVDAIQNSNYRSRGYAYINSYGNYNVAAKPFSCDYYWVAWNADSDHDVAFSPARVIMVRPKVGERLSTSRVRVRRYLRLSGSVAPKHRGTIYIRAKVGTRWGTAFVLRLSTRSTFAVTFAVLRRGRYQFRAYYLGDSANPAHMHVSGRSAAKSLVVY